VISQTVVPDRDGGADGVGRAGGTGGADHVGSAELALVLLADARLPTGSHTQSAGLEPALQAGLDPSEVPAYLAGRLRTVTRVEAGTAVVARHAVLTGGALRPVRDAWAARTPSQVLRASGEQLGRGYLRLFRRLWPHAPEVEALVALGRPPRPVVLGAVAAYAGLSAAQVVRLVGYDDAQTIASATLKLAPFDPVEATAWVLAARPLIEEMVCDLQDLTAPVDVPALSAPLAELWAQDHAVSRERMFSA
jgi:urease accessory protein